MPTIVKMPKWGLTMTAGTVVDWLQPEGAEITEGDPLLTVETEKAVDDVPAPANGILYRIVAATGSEVPVSAPVAVIVSTGETLSDDEIAALVTSAQPAQEGAAAVPAGQGSARAARSAARDRSGRINASPAAKKRAAELGVDLARVEATGPNGRITSDDVERAAADAGGGEVEERDIPLADGRHIHALLAGPGKASTLVFLHGLAGSFSSWQIVLGDLADSWRLVAIDLPGHGQSAKTSGADYTVRGYATAIGEALNALGVRDVILVGHSFGGAVAMQLAGTHADLVKGLVLIDSAGLGETISEELSALMTADPGPETARNLLALFMHDQKLVSQRAIDEMAANQTSEGAWPAQQDTAQAAFAGGMQAGFDADALRLVQKPVLIIWGEKDQVIPVEHAFEAARILPDSVVAVVPGIGHVPQVESPPRVTQLIERFARSLG